MEADTSITRLVVVGFMRSNVDVQTDNKQHYEGLVENENYSKENPSGIF